MSDVRPAFRPLLLIGLCVLALGCAPGRARAGVSVGLTPAAQTVAPGSDFDLFVDVLAAGSSFNGFDAVVGYDPAALTFLPLSPTTAQQGCLMTGTCSASCGSTFHRFSGAGDSLSVSDVLLCNLVSITGPGHLYKLRFHAASTLQITHVTFRSVHFYDAGVFVTPVQSGDATIGIGMNVGVGPPAPSLAGRVRVEPNPSFGRVRFVAEGAGGGLAEIEILDLQGRVVRRLGPARLGSASPLVWDGRDAHGARVAAGIYPVKIRRGGEVQYTRAVLLQ